MTAFIQTGHEFVGDLLSRQIDYRVPEHQRDYAWTEDEVSQFWDDLRNELREQNEHFLGPIVVRQVTEDRSYEIIDGQQRFATTLILLAAIRNSYHEQDDSLYLDIQSTYFGRMDRRTREIVPKFTMNSTNNDHFHRYIANIVPIKTVQERARRRTVKVSNKRILNAYIFFKHELDKITLSNDGDFNSIVLADLEDFVRRNLSVIQIVVSDEADAYTLFETLNERGIELSVLDLLKNYLFKKSGSSIETVKRQWHETLANLDDNVGTRFIRHYWVSKNGRVQAGRLYREIRDSAKTRANVMKLSEDLRQNSAVYEALMLPDDSLWDESQQEVRNNLTTLKTLNAVQCMPVLLAAYQKFAKADFEKVVWLMAIMAVRYSLICSYRTGALEIKYAEVARDISIGKAKRAGAVVRQLADLYPSDLTFKAAFETVELGSAKHARFLLRELELEHNRGMAPVDDPGVLNLEHIAPKEKNAQWKSLGDMEGEPYASWVARLGNQALLDKRENHALGAASFAEKRKTLKKSSVSLTKIIAEEETWGTAQVKGRQKRLADLAVARWRY